MCLFQEEVLLDCFASSVIRNLWSSMVTELVIKCAAKLPRESGSVVVG